MKTDKEKRLNIDKLFEAANGDESFIRSMIAFFIERTPGLIAELTDAYNNEDCERARKLSHRLKASVDLAGNAKMRKLLRKIHRNSASEETCGKNKKLTVKLSEETGKTIHELRKLLRKPRLL